MIKTKILNGIEIITGGNISIGGSPGGASSAEYAKGRKYLEGLAQNSGGREFEAQSMTNTPDRKR